MICISIPSAYLGQAAAFLPQNVARICSHCPDKAQAEAYAAEQGQECTHAICPACFERVMAEINLYQQTNNVS